MDREQNGPTHDILYSLVPLTVSLVGKGAESSEALSKGIRTLKENMNIYLFLSLFFLYVVF